MTNQELMSFVKDSLQLKSIDEDSQMGKVRGWDSLRHVKLISLLEKKLQIEIPTDLIGELTSIKALASYLKDYEFKN